MALSIGDFLQAFQGVQDKHGYWMAKCPAHDDDKQSLSINKGKNGGIVVKCHAGCQWQSILDAAGLDAGDIMPESVNGNHPKKEIVATYDYRDESGKLLYQAVRFEPKDFSQRRPDGSGHWIWGLSGGQYAQSPNGDWYKPNKGTPANRPRRTFPDLEERVLYRLPELIADESDGWAFIAEGEQDVDNTLRAWGLTATTNVGGAGKWKREYSKHLRGRKVCILPDNDPPPDESHKEGFAGQKHAIKVYESLKEVAECVVILALPDLPIKGDVTDWKKAGGTKEQLIKMADELAALGHAGMASRVSQYMKLVADPDYRGDPAVALRSEVRQERRTIWIDYGMLKKLSDLTELSWKALVQANNPPKYFRKGNSLVKAFEDNDNDVVMLQELGQDRMRCELDLAADWRNKGEQGMPPEYVVKNVLVWPERPFPILDRIVRVPVFGPSGKLETEPGYHADGRTYFKPLRHLKILPVPPKPSELQVIKALGLLKELIHDFPFESAADKCHALALLLLPFVRDMIDGPTPLHLIEASKERTGKSLLAQMLLWISIGRDYFDFPEAGDNQDEWQKQITTALTSGKSVVIIDNINSRLDSGHLARAITNPIWDGRILKSNESANVAIRCVWAATANNIKMSGEMTGRTIRCRLVSEHERPELRSNFLHPDLKEWVIREQERLIQAAHTVVQHWIQEGKPKPHVKALGMFEHWTWVIGGILESAGVEGFLTNYTEAAEEMNDDAATWRRFCALWFKACGSEPKTIAELLPVAQSVEGFYLKGETDEVRKRSLSQQLRAKKKQVYETKDIKDEVLQRLQIRNDAPVRHGGAQQWYLRLVTDDDQAAGETEQKPKPWEAQDGLPF
jgi:hypothetical protein